MPGVIAPRMSVMVTVEWEETHKTLVEAAKKMDEAARYSDFPKKTGDRSNKICRRSTKAICPRKKISQQEESEIYQQTPGVHWPDLGCERAIT